MRVESTQLEFNKENIKEKSTMNPLYEDDIENEFQQNIHDIKRTKQEYTNKIQSWTNRNWISYM